MWPSTIEGRPAFGRHERNVRECCDRYRRCSVISVGPVAQLSPMTSGRSASSAVSAAPISEPTSSRPVVSTVTCTMIGTSIPAVAIARRAPMIAALHWRRSWTVSMRRTSMPPASSPATIAS